MSVPVPLGVRFFSVIDAGERWVTRWVDDLQFRSVVPGGFASATITLRVPRGVSSLAHPDPLGFSRLVELFTRIQVVDLRSLEVAWEGRIEDPARQVEPDTWQIGALGSMVAATDVQRPVFYIDTDINNWVGGDWNAAGGHVSGPYASWSNDIVNDSVLQSKQRAENAILWTAGNTILGYRYSYRWASHGYDQAIARFTTTHDAIGPSDTEEPHFSLVVGIAANNQIDATGFEVSGDTTKTNVIGTDFTDQNTRYIVLGVRRDSGTATYSVSDGAQAIQTSWKNISVVGMRMDRNGNKLTTAAKYPGDYVTVAQVVEDVLGRFLVGGWYEGGTNVPWPGSVRPNDAYIDTSDTTHILHLIYPNGATAADILTDLANQVQTNAYWAIWESAWKAGTPNTDFGTNSGYRFEWTTWPANVGYFATSQDGFEGQPNGDDVWNFAFYQYPDNGDSNQPHLQTTWLTDDMAPELLAGGFTRATTVTKSDPTDGTTASTLADAYLVSKSQVKNAGTLTVKRPIQFYDPGTNSGSGSGRMVDPWMIRPGKLIRIRDLPPRAGTTDMSYGATAPNSALDGTIFRVVATEYSTADNSCRLELDQVATWQIPTQIRTAAGGTQTIRIQ